MRAAFWVGCAALLLSACSSEPVQQATAAHVSPGMKAAMSSAGELIAHFAGYRHVLAKAELRAGDRFTVYAFQNKAVVLQLLAFDGHFSTAHTPCHYDAQGDQRDDFLH